MNGSSISSRRALTCFALNDDHLGPPAGDSQVAPTIGAPSERYPRALLRLLDRQPPRAAAVAILLLISTAFAYAFLGRYPAFAVLRAVVTGPEAAQYAPHMWPRLTVPHLIGDCLLAGIVGIIAGAAMRRLRWMIPPLIVLAVTCAWMAIALVSSGNGRPVVPGSSTLIQYHLNVTVKEAAYVAAVLVCAALGGVLSMKIARRVPISLFVTAAFAWIIAAVLGSLFTSWWVAQYSDVTYSSLSLPELALLATETLPFAVAGVFMVWALRQRSLWTAALILGALPALQLLSGMVKMWSPGGQVVNTLNEILWVLKPFACAAVGAWLAEAVLALRPWPDLVGHGLIVIAVIIVAAMVGYWATW